MTRRAAVRCSPMVSHRRDLMWSYGCRLPPSCTGRPSQLHSRPSRSQLQVDMGMTPGHMHGGIHALYVPG